MNQERWDEIKRMVAEKFGQENVLRKELEHGGFVEFLEFNSPMGRIELEFRRKPKLVDTKTLYSNRIGSDVKVERVYSQDEFVHIFKAYRYDESSDSWQPIESSGFLNM